MRRRPAAGAGGSRASRLGLVTLAAASGGSALGAAFLTLPVILFDTVGADGFAASMVFAVSLPFTLAGAACLSGLSLLWRDSLSERFSDYFGIILASAPVGAIMPLPLFGGAGLFFGALFGPLTAATWALLYSRFVFPRTQRETGCG